MVQKLFSRCCHHKRKQHQPICIYRTHQPSRYTDKKGKNSQRQKRNFLRLPAYTLSNSFRKVHIEMLYPIFTELERKRCVQPPNKHIDQRREKSNRNTAEKQQIPCRFLSGRRNTDSRTIVQDCIQSRSRKRE